MKKLFVFLLLFASFCYGQDQPSSNLRLGKPCPDLTVENVLYGPKTSVSISDYRGKLLILDFWGTWCAPCVAMLPRCEEIEKAFPGQVAFLGVTDEPADKVTRFFEQRKRATGLVPIATVTSDTVLYRYFRHRTVPHYVWINPEGIVCAITGKDEVTIENVRSVLQRENVSLPQKRDEPTKILVGEDRVGTTLFPIGNLIKDGEGTRFEKLARENLKYSSILTGYIPGVGVASVFSPLRLTQYNILPRTLFQIAFGNGSLEFIGQPNRILFEVEDSTKYGAWPDVKTRPGRAERQELLTKVACCYEIQVAPELKDQMYKIMQDDLNRYFGALYGTVVTREKRKRTVLRLTCDDGGALLKSRGAASAEERSAFRWKVVNKPWSHFSDTVRTIRRGDARFPVIDETGIDRKFAVDFEIETEVDNFESLREVLQRYNLVLEEEVREIDMIVVREKN